MNLKRFLALILTSFLCFAVLIPQNISFAHNPCVEWKNGECVDVKIHDVNRNHVHGYTQEYLDYSGLDWNGMPYPKISGQFTEIERVQILRGLTNLKRQMGREEVKQCINKYSTKWKGPQDARYTAVFALVNGIYHPKVRLGQGVGGKGRQIVYIDRIYETNGPLGKMIGIGNAINNDYHIQINAAYLSGPTTDRLINQLSDTIMHEILHAWGYWHPKLKKNKATGEFDFAPAIGTLPYEAGWCVRRNGADKVPGTFGLNGSVDPNAHFID